MAKRKITVTVDEQLVRAVQELGDESLSSIVNAALAGEVDRRARAASLRRALAEWEAAFGPVDEETAAWASVVFDDVDALDVGPTHAEPGAA